MVRQETGEMMSNRNPSARQGCKIAITIKRLCVMLLAVVFLFESQADDRPPFDRDIVTNYYLRLSAPEAKGARVKIRIVHSHHAERPMNGWDSQIGEDGRSGWIQMPRYRRKAGSAELWYQSCIFMFHPGQERYDRYKWFEEPMTVGLEIAEAPNGVPILTLPAQRVAGGVVSVLFDVARLGEPPKVCWFADHLDALEKALAEAGCGELQMPRSAHVHGELAIHSWHWEKSLLTRDPRLRLKINELLRRLGINCSDTFFHADPAKEDRFDTEFGWFITTQKDLYVPYDSEWHNRSRAYWEKRRSQARGNVSELAVLKIGDEVGMIGEYTNSPAFRATFESFRERLAPEVPAGVAVEFINTSALTNRPATREARLVRYLTVRARAKETAVVFRAATDDVKAIFGSNVKTEANLIPWYGGEGGNWQQTLFNSPGPFLLAREGSLDYPEMQGMTPYAVPTGPIANAMLVPAFVAQMRELNTRPGGRSREMLFPCRCEPASYDHGFMSALLNGNTDFTYYNLGFHGTWCEWADSPEKLVAVAKCNRMLYDAAPYLLGQKRAGADMALLLSESTDVWRTETRGQRLQPNYRNYCKCEMRGCYYALRFSGYRVDFVREHMIEDGFLDGYKVLWANMRNLNRVSQRAILDWVNDGGALVLTPGALAYDEADDPSHLFDTYRAEGESSALDGAECAEFDYKKRDVSAPVRETPVGKGKVFAFPWLPGMNFCAGALRQRELFRDLTPNGNTAHEILSGVVRYGVPWWMEGNEAVREKVASIAEATGAKRQILLSHGNIDAGVLDEGGRAFVGFSNYNPNMVKNVTAGVSKNVTHL